VNTATETAASGTTSATTGTTSAPPDIAVSATTRDTGQTQPGATSTTTNQPGATTTPATVPTTPTEVTETPESPLGRLSVDSDPSGAKISLDDKTNPNWVTPYTFNDVPEGPHRVSISRDGFTTVTRTAKVRAGHPQPLVVNLDPVKVEPVPKNPAPAVTAGAGSGVLQIVSTPPGAIISIDGKQVGASPVNQTVSSGPHTYRAELPGTVPYEATVVVEDGGIYPIRVRWGGAVSAPGTLEISTSPAGASVSIDGIGRGATPANIKLQAGTHHLAIEMAGYQTISEDITVSNNQTIQVNRTLSPR